MNYPYIRIDNFHPETPDILEKLEDANGQRPADFGLEATVYNNIGAEIWG